MKQRQQIVDTDATQLSVGRYRQVPSGFVGLRADFGLILRSRRKAYGKQTAIAEAVGIAAASLSRIENGHVIPRLETLDTLLAVLDLDWSAVAIPGDRHTALSLRHDRIFDEGRAIRDARRAARLTLRDLAHLSGLSIAQLSRVERGESAGSRVFYDDPDDAELPRGERRLLHVNTVLDALIRGTLNRK
jgi:transcriptional regulator with XRE-family HTH domain